MGRLVRAFRAPISLRAGLCQQNRQRAARDAGEVWEADRRLFVSDGADWSKTLVYSGNARQEFSTDAERQQKIDTAWYERVSRASARLEEAFYTQFFEELRAKREGVSDAQ